VDIVNGACLCNPSYSFYEFENKCRCDDLDAVIMGGTCFNCGNFPNGTGKGDFGNIKCVCLPTFIWDAASKTCHCPANSIIGSDGSCYSCNAIANSTNTADPANF
jgi:hypothetical protein